MPRPTASLDNLIGATEALRQSLDAAAKPSAHGQKLLFIDDIPLQFRSAFEHQAHLNSSSMITVDGKPAVEMKDVDAWIDIVVRSFHLGDNAERVPGRSATLRRFGFGGIADRQVDAGELTAAIQHADKEAYLGPLALQIAQSEGAPAPLEPKAPKKGIVAQFRELVKGKVSKKLKNKIVADGKVEVHEVWQLIHRVRSGKVTDTQIEDLKAFRDEYQHMFEPDALGALNWFVGLEDPNAQAQPRPSESLKKLWKETRTNWNLDQITPPEKEVSYEEHLEKSYKIFRATNEDGYRLSNEVKAFFERYPSTAGRVLSAFFAGWAINETFYDHPLQAYNYTLAHPVDDKGKPRNELWQAYADAVDTGAPRAIIEEAFFRATIADYKRAANSEEFRQMYQWAPKDYRKAIDAYVFTLMGIEADLDSGKDPVLVAKHYPLAVTRELIKRGTIGMVWNAASFRNGLSFSNKLTQEWWFGFWGMLGTFISNRHPKTAEATKIQTELSESEAKELNASFGMNLEPGMNVLDAAAFDGATFKEDLRGTSVDRPSYPLKLEDFLERDPLHPGYTYSGLDGVFQAEEVRSVVRQATARVRSDLIQDFHDKYPVPMNGWLVYSANMLAMTGSYAQHKAYDMVPQYIMPVDNNGNPKTEKWQIYVDKYEQHKAEGHPSMEVLQRLWFDAHMEDFQQVDRPDFRQELEGFWAKAVKDPALAPLATYFVAMVHGREVFDAARDNEKTHEQALVDSFKHFQDAILTARSIPFWQEELSMLGKYLLSPSFRNGPDADDRGLPTNKALLTRAMKGLSDSIGVVSTLRAAGGLKQILGLQKPPVRKPSTSLMDLADVLSPEDLAKVDPMVVDFYKNPAAFDASAQMHWGSAMAGPKSLAEAKAFHMMRPLMDAITGAAVRMGQIQLGGDPIPPGKYAMEYDVTTDEKQNTHWNRYVVRNGRRDTLFRATFDVVDGQVREVFKTPGGSRVELYFNVRPYEGGIKLTLDRQKSDGRVKAFGTIDFITQPSPEGDALKTEGTFTFNGIATNLNRFEARLEPKHDSLSIRTANRDTKKTHDRRRASA